jgi:hypothetical protein
MCYERYFNLSEGQWGTKFTALSYLSAETMLVDVSILVVPIRGSRETSPVVLLDDEIDLIPKQVESTWAWRRSVSLRTLVKTTISSRGRLNCLIAFPRIFSDSPFEYIYRRSSKLQSRSSRPYQNRDNARSLYRRY